MHNYYTYLYNQTVFDAAAQAPRRGRGGGLRPLGDGRRPSSSRCTGAATASRRSKSMAGDLRGGLSLGLSGFGFWSHDIGGFEGTPTPALFKRWIAFGLLSSHSRLHGNSSYRVPWAVRRGGRRRPAAVHPAEAPADAVPVPGRRGRPHDEGIPVMRAMVLEFPDDPACTTLERQYMLGDDLLVAPVLRDDGDVDYYVPEGSGPPCSAGPR